MPPYRAMSKLIKAEKAISRASTNWDGRVYVAGMKKPRKFCCMRRSPVILRADLGRSGIYSQSEIRTTVVVIGQPMLNFSLRRAGLRRPIGYNPRPRCVAAVLRKGQVLH